MPDRDYRNLTGRKFADETARLDADLLARVPGARLPAPVIWYRVGFGLRPLWACSCCGKRTRYLYKGRRPEGTQHPAADLPMPNDAEGATSVPIWCCRRCADLHYASEWECRATRAARRAKELWAEAQAAPVAGRRPHLEKAAAREELAAFDIQEKWFIDGAKDCGASGAESGQRKPLAKRETDPSSEG